jgi:tetratricopeptide (TPR) repeat protein
MTGKSLRATALAGLTIVAVLLAARAGFAVDDELVNLLQLPSAKVEWTTSPTDATAIAPLTDGDAKTVAEIDATEATPLDVTFTFGGGVVAPEGIRVTLPEGSDSAAARVEILVSTVSARAGFRSLRADPLAANGKPQTFEFPTTAARWIIVRLAPQSGARKVAAAEVEIIGREGEPKSHYAFAESPAQAFDVLTRLEKTTSLKLVISEDEKAMFAKAKAGRLTPVEFAEAALLASGVVDGGKRKEYLKRLDALEQQARAAVANARTPEAKGEALLKWLHSGPMSKGYVAHQTDLSVIIDTGTFNCVSSAVLYNALALRLGLDMRAIEVPDHAFSILYDGTRHMDVETTNANGFNPARDKAAIAKFEQMTGFRYIPDAHRDQRREVDEAGLAAIIYYNHGVMLSDAKRYHEALVANFRAMSLDPEFGSAVKNTLAVLAKWGTELSHDGKFQEALDVVTTGLALAPKDATLVNNLSAVWSQWALSAVDAGKPAEALAILERAAAAVPGGGFEGMQSLVYIRPADARIREGRWEDALAAAVPGFEVLASEPRKELEKWLGYFGQEWSAALAKKEGEAEALVALRGLAARFPGNEHVASAADSHVRRMAYRLADAGKFEEALAAIQEAKDLMKDAAGVREVSLYVYDNWAKRHMKDGQWEQAADVYVKALARYPEASLLQQNVAYLGQEWTKAAYAKGGTPAAAAVAEALAARFPHVESVAKSGGKEVARAVHDAIENEKFEVALAAVDQGKELLQGNEAQELYFAAYDGWAKHHMRDGQWEKAADVYSAGLARFPAMEKLQGNIGWFAQEWAKEVAAAQGPDKAADVLRALKQKFPGVQNVARSAQNHLNNTVNALVRDGKQEEALAVLERLRDLAEGEADVERLAVFAYDRWARTFIDKKDWDEAIAIYDKGLAGYPNQSLFKQNKAYCIEQKSR